MKHSIVGPRFYQIYLIVVAALAGAGLVAAIVTMGMSVFSATSTGVNALDFLGNALAMFFSVFVFGIGMATLTFAALERLVPGDEIKLSSIKGSELRNLIVNRGQKPVNPAGLIAEIAFLALVLTLIYFFSEWQFVSSILSPAFFAIYLPLMGIRWGLTMLQNLVLLRQRRWQPGTVLGSLLLEVFDIYILTRLISGPSILAGDTFIGIPGDSIDVALRLAFFVALVVIVVLTP